MHARWWAQPRTARAIWTARTASAQGLAPRWGRTSGAASMSASATSSASAIISEFSLRGRSLPAVLPSPSSSRSLSLRYPRRIGDMGRRDPPRGGPLVASSFSSESSSLGGFPEGAPAAALLDRVPSFVLKVVLGADMPPEGLAPFP